MLFVRPNLEIKAKVYVPSTDISLFDELIWKGPPCQFTAASPVDIKLKFLKLGTALAVTPVWVRGAL